MYNTPMFFFDLETTGLDVSTCGIVQIAYIAREGNSEISNSIVMNPGCSIDERASEVHGFKDEDVKDLDSFDKHADTLFNYADGKYWVGYNNVVFDIPIFINHFRRAGMTPPKCLGVIDCYRLFTHHYGNGKRGQRCLQAAHVFYCGNRFEGAHDALSDIRATANVLDAMIVKHPDLADIRRAVEISQASKYRIDSRGFWRFHGKKHIAIVNCGKFCGTPIEQLPDNYLAWVAGNKSFPADTRKVAQDALLGVFPKWKY